MTKEDFQNKVNDFFQKNKYLKLIDVVATTEDNHQCQVCGNTHLNKLCHVRNDERNEEWFIGWDCWGAVEELQEKEEKARFKEIVVCFQCGKESLRGTLPRRAYAASLCKQCWLEKNNIPILAKGMG